MTQTTINLMETKPVSEIKKGTIVKKNGDMFIVAKVSEAQFKDFVEEALFHNSYPNSHQRPQRSTFNHGSPRDAVRNPPEAKHLLISLSTGSKFYPEFLTLNELLCRMNNAGFVVVENVEIKEVY